MHQLNKVKVLKVTEQVIPIGRDENT